jgi:hypothetical protein
MIAVLNRLKRQVVIPGALSSEPRSIIPASCKDFPDRRFAAARNDWAHDYATD